MSSSQKRIELTQAQASKMYSDGVELPAAFLLIRDDGTKIHVSLAPGARISKPENPAINPKIRAALVDVADLTEYNKLGPNAPENPALSNMIDSGEAFFMANDARLREVVLARCKQLESWLAAPDMNVTYTDPDQVKETYTDPDQVNITWRMQKQRVSKAKGALGALAGWF